MFFVVFFLVIQKNSHGGYVRILLSLELKQRLKNGWLEVDLFLLGFGQTFRVFLLLVFREMSSQVAQYKNP